MKNLRFLPDNVSSIQTIEDVKQFLRALRSALVQEAQKQGLVNQNINEQLEALAATEEDLFLRTDFGEIIAPDSDDAIETES